MIPYSTQEIDQDDIDAVTDTLKSNWLTQGPKVSQFEKILSKKCESKYCITFNSATSALHAACSSFDLGPGDNVWTSANTFAATANVVLLCGAKIDFLDIDPETLNIDVNILEDKLKNASISGTLPKLLITVHFSGESCDMKSIHDLSLKYGFKILEDASHALGATYNSKPIGSCEFSSMTVFSFHPVKMITTGEGGCVTTNSKIIEEKVRDFGRHGITKEKERFSVIQNLDWYYEQQSLGYNYRMNELSASLGISQLSKLNYFVKTRNDLAENYNKILPKQIIIPKRNNFNTCSYHLYPILLPDKPNLKRDNLFLHLRKLNFGVQVHYIPVYHHPYYRNNGFKDYFLNNTENYFKRCLSLPLFPSLKKGDQKQVSSAIESFLKTY